MIITQRILLFGLFTCLLSVQGAQRPNIIFLLADDQTFYSMGCYGNPDVKTPHMDRLGADGVIFDRHYDTTAICMASRASIMTGLVEFRNGTNFEHGPMLKKTWQQSYPILLRQAGYVTGFAGKFGFEVSEAPGKKAILPEEDFDRWGGGPGQTSYDTARNKSMKAYAKEYPHSTLSYGAFGRDFIRDFSKGGKPFCLSISFKAPHKPATPDPRFDHVYKGKTFKKPDNYGRENGEHFSKQSRMGRQYERFESWGYKDQYDEVMATYHQQIHAIDVALGMIRDALDVAVTAGNTVIIYTSDNGFLCGSHGYGSKVLPYEEASRVPLIIHDPRHASSGKGLRCSELTGNIDFLPTILELAGLDVPEGIDGRSLLPLLDDPSRPIHQSLPLINVWGPRQVHSLAVVTKEWKYVYWPYGGAGFDPTEELFQVGADSLELRELSHDPSYLDDLTRMRGGYDSLVQRWKKEAVSHNNYRPFGIIFDRKQDWEKKARLYR